MDARGRVQRIGRPPAADARQQHERRARERAPLRRDAAPHARDRRAGRSGTRHLVDARPRHGDGPDRAATRRICRTPTPARSSCPMPAGRRIGRSWRSATSPRRSSPRHRGRRRDHRQPGAERPRRVHQRHAASDPRALQIAGHAERGGRAPDGGAADGRQDREGRDGRLAHRRAAVRRQRARVPRRPVVAGHRGDRERAPVRGVAAARRASSPRSTRCRSSSAASST